MLPLLCGLLLVLLVQSQDPTEVHVRVDMSAVKMRTDSRYLSIAIDSSAMNEQSKWEAWESHMNSSALLALTRAMAPSYLRIGGTACDIITYDMTDAGPCPTPSSRRRRRRSSSSSTVEAPAPTPQNPFVLDRCRWTSVLAWATQTGLPVLFGLNVLSHRTGTSSPSGSGGAWDPTNALELMHYTQELYPHAVAGWELGNEPEGWIRNFGINITHEELGKDFYEFRRVAGPAAFIVGPDYGIQGCITKGYPCKDYDESVSALAEHGGTVNMSTYHHYNLGNTDTAAQFTDPHILDRSRAAVEAGVAANAAAARGAPVWLGEGATASGGGVTGASGTYSATFIWLDKLGAVGRFGGSGLMRQSLFGGRYALLDPTTFAPRPTYWVAVLFKQLVSSPVVWAVDGDTAANRTVRLYARRAGGSDGDEGSSVVVFGSNVQAEAAALHFDPSMVSNPATRREDYVLTGDLGGDSILLNGVAMALELAGHGHDGASAAAAPTVPTFNGKVAANASEPLVMAPFSSFFSVFHHSVPPRSAPTRWHGK